MENYMSFNQPVYTDLFSEINGYLKNSDIFREKFNKVLSFDFNIFDFWGRYIDENRMSEILAFFLDPNKSHGQGTSFLKEFLNFIKVEKDIINSINNEEITVTLESRTLEDRRMDIHIDIGGTFGVCIENKIWADDQKDQIRDYRLHLEQKYKIGNYHLIYLTPNGKDPSSKSIKKGYFKILKENNIASCISYQDDIIKLINRFISVCESERVRYFLTELSVYLKKRFKGEKFMDDKDKIVEFVCKNKEKLRVAFEIIKVKEEIKTQLVNKLFNQLQEKEENLIITKNPLPFESGAGFWFSKKGWDNVELGYIFDGVDYKKPNLVIRKVDHPKINSLRECINAEDLNTGGYNSEVWIWASKLLEDWNISSDIWQNINLGNQTCDDILSAINPVVKIIDSVLNSE